MVQLSHLYMTTRKNIALTIWIFVIRQVMSLLLNIPSRFVIAFLLRSKCLWSSWLQSLSAMILEPKKIKSVTAFTFSPSIFHEVMGLDAMILVFLSFKPAFSLPSLTVINKLFSSSSLSLLLKWYHFHIWGYWYFCQQSWFQLWFIRFSILHNVLCIEVK